MKITDSPGAISVMPFSAIADAKVFESSSTFQPVMLTGVAPLFVSSNQSAAYGALPLAQGVTSVMKTDADGGGSSFTTSVSVSVKSAVASGVEPTDTSSTVTVTL
jgi:hypothetical protein